MNDIIKCKHEDPNSLSNFVFGISKVIKVIFETAFCVRLVPMHLLINFNS